METAKAVTHAIAIAILQVDSINLLMYFVCLYFFCTLSTIVNATVVHSIPTRVVNYFHFLGLVKRQHNGGERCLVSKIVWGVENRVPLLYAKD